MSASTYKVGDKVRFRRDMEDGILYGGLHYIARFMDEHRGRVMRITRCHGGDHYFLDGFDLNGLPFYASAAMLERAEEEAMDPAWSFDRANLGREDG